MDRVWQALTDPEFTQQYYFGSRIDMPSFTPGARYRYLAGDTVLLAGEILESDPPNRLVMSFDARWDPSLADDAPSRLTWELIAEEGGLTRLRLVHDEFGESSATADQVAGGWPWIVSGLKTLLETGAAMAPGVQGEG
jgi:uncharacterized protein YndB with AHSA1/START domain